MDDLSVVNFYVILANILLSIIGFFGTKRLISKCGDMFIKANLYGMDLCKGTKNKM